jgi:hypothetical protein
MVPSTLLSDLNMIALGNRPEVLLDILMPGMELPDHQMFTLRRMWEAEYIYSSSGRSTGKTALTGIFLALWCASHPGTKVLCVGLKFLTAKSLISFIEDLLNKYPELAKCVEPVGASNYAVHGSDQWKMVFKNGSQILAVPSDINKKGARVRGLRCSILVIDEIAAIPAAIVRQAFVPCCSIRDKFGNRKLIRLTTGGYRPSEAWDDCRKHYQKAASGDPKYAFFNFNYKDVDPKFSYIIDRDAILEMEADATADEIAREIMGYWTEAGGNYYQAGIIERNRLRAIELEVYPEESGTPGGVYVIGVDPAFSGTDETAICVLKNLPNGKWGIVHSFAINHKGGWAQKNAELLVDYIERFDPIYIAADSNGGEQLLHELKSHYQDNPKQCPIRMDNEHFEEGREIVRLFVPSSSGKDSNTRLNSRLLRGLDGNGEPILLMPGSTETDEDMPKLTQIDRLMQQLINVQATPLEAPGLFKFSSTQRKDRYSALLYAWNAVEELALDADDFDGYGGNTNSYTDDILVI